MSVDAGSLTALGLDRLIDDAPFAPGRDGLVANPAGERVVFAPSGMLLGLHHVIERERSGAWRGTMKASGHAAGRALAVNLDAKLAALGRPALAALPLEASLALLQRHFALQGWGRLALELTDAAAHGLVVARLHQSYFVAVLDAVDDFVDAFPAGLLQGFFEYISGQTLGCEEIACARRGAPHCTFVIIAPERLALVMPRLGRENADAILALLRS